MTIMTMFDLKIIYFKVAKIESLLFEIEQLVSTKDFDETSTVYLWNGVLICNAKPAKILMKSLRVISFFSDLLRLRGNSVF